MEVVRKFNSFEEQEKFEKEYWYKGICCGEV